MNIYPCPECSHERVCMIYHHLKNTPGKEHFNIKNMLCNLFIRIGSISTTAPEKITVDLQTRINLINKHDATKETPDEPLDSSTCKTCGEHVACAKCDACGAPTCYNCIVTDANSKKDVCETCYTEIPAFRL